MIKLNIQYSSIYDRRIHEWRNQEYKELSKEEISNIDKLKKTWSKIESKSFKVLSKVSNLKWKKTEIDCYLARKTAPFSTPLTIPIKKDIDSLIETILHELIHNLLLQNPDKIKKSNVKKYIKKYGKLSRTTLLHILVHAILKKALMEIFGETQTKLFIKKYDNMPDYKKAWEIVEKETSEEIIKNIIA